MRAFKTHNRNLLKGKMVAAPHNFLTAKSVIKVWTRAQRCSSIAYHFKQKKSIENLFQVFKELFIHCKRS